MRHTRVVVASTVAVAAAALFAAPVAAQEEEPPVLPISVTPPSGLPGTVFTFSGEECIGEEGPGDVEVIVFFADNEVVDAFALTPEADGSWATDFDTGVPEPLPPGVYTVTATCFVSPESEKVIADYDFADFEITAPPKPPEPTTPPAPGPEPAKPAAPVVARPTFTG
jgi:hypothetical protein